MAKAFASSVSMRRRPSSPHSAKATRGRKLLMFNVSAADDALRQAQCQSHVFHTLPNHAMQTDAMAQFLVLKKWRSILLLEGPRPDDKLLSAAFQASAKRFGLKIVEKRGFVLSNDPVSAIRAIPGCSRQAPTTKRYSLPIRTASSHAAFPIARFCRGR